MKFDLNTNPHFFSVLNFIYLLIMYFKFTFFFFFPLLRDGQALGQVVQKD